MRAFLTYAGPTALTMIVSGCVDGIAFWFTDETWAIWEPLIEVVRPRDKTPPHDLRRTIAAIFWCHENGAKWWSIPAEPGPWWRAAQLFIRWTKLGVWERLLEQV